MGWGAGALGRWGCSVDLGPGWSVSGRGLLLFRNPAAVARRARNGTATKNRSEKVEDDDRRRAMAACAVPGQHRAASCFVRWPRRLASACASRAGVG